MTGSVPSVLRADDALRLEADGHGAFEAGFSEAGLDAAAAETQFEQSLLKTHEMQAELARAAEAGEFGAAGARSSTNDAALLSLLAMLESAKDKLDRVRLRA